MCQTVKNKNVANISRHLGSERRDFFFESPLHITGLLNTRQWTAQLSIPSKAYRWSLGRGSKCCGGISNVEADHAERTAFSHALTKEAPLMRPLSWAIRASVPKQGAVRVWYSILLICAPEFCHSMGAMSTKNCESDFCQLVIAHERCAKVRLCKTAPAKAWFNISLPPLRTSNKQASKIWPLARGFLPYKRESTDYKSY